MILSLTKLSKSFFHRPVIREISSSVEAGEIIGIIGKNGVGKSTLMRILTGLSSADSGQVQIEGELLSPGNWASRRDTLYLGHSPGLYQAFSAVENLAFAAGLYKVADVDEKVLMAIDRVGLSHQKDDAIKVYSQGMTQRLKLALAMIIPWKVLLFDEPFSGLDTQGRKLAESVMEQWRNDKRTMLFVDHNLEWVLKFCTRVLFLDEWKIVLDSGTEDEGAEIIRKSFRERVG